MTSTRSPQRTTIPKPVSDFLTTDDSIESDESLRRSVQKISIGLYGFLMSIRRLGKRLNTEMGTFQSGMKVPHFISARPGYDVSDIARLRFLCPSNVPATVHRLPNDGLIECENNTKDRRAQNLYISNDGETLLEQLIDHWGVLVYEIVRTMPQRDVRVLIRVLPPLLKLVEHSESYVEER